MVRGTSDTAGRLAMVRGTSDTAGRLVMVRGTSEHGPELPRRTRQRARGACDAIQGTQTYTAQADMHLISFTGRGRTLRPD